MGLIFLSLNSCGSSSVTFDDFFIAFRILYGAMNLGISFVPCALAKLGSLSIGIPNHLFGILCQAYSVC